MSVRWFEAVRGHARAKEVLSRALEVGRVPPALVLAGRPGIGRSLLARELAKALNCAEACAPTGSRPCNACPSCRKIEKGAHADVVTIAPDEGKAALGIDQVRAALDELALAPVEGRRRVFIFDPADALTPDAQNALLKLLEEPPARTHLVLLTRHEEALLPTIASRSFILGLGELSAADVGAILEAKGVAHGEAVERAAWALGCPGLALGETHLDRVEDAKLLLEALASGRAGKDPLGVASELVARAAPKNADPQERRDSALEVTSLVARALRDALDRAARGAAAARISGADARLLDRLARSGAAALSTMMAACARADEAIVANQNVNLALEGLVLDAAAALAPSTEVREAKRAPPDPSAEPRAGRPEPQASRSENLVTGR
jgi:DNA polymerase-3 subunit delta'